MHITTEPLVPGCNAGERVSNAPRFAALGPRKLGPRACAAHGRCTRVVIKSKQQIRELCALIRRLLDIFVHASMLRGPLLVSSHREGFCLFVGCVGLTLIFLWISFLQAHRGSIFARPLDAYAKVTRKNNPLLLLLTLY